MEVIFESDSRIREICGFSWCKSLHRIEIPPSAELISGFRSCDSLVEVLFESESQLREIDGFNECMLLPAMSIPASVEILLGFNQCSNLTRITFEPICLLRMIKGFGNSHISSLEIPASVESVIGFDGDCSPQLIFREGTRIKRIKVKKLQSSGNRYSHPVFVAYDERDLRKNRRGSNLV
jgi:hypothetical protein